MDQKLKTSRIKSNLMKSRSLYSEEDRKDLAELMGNIQNDLVYYDEQHKTSLEKAREGMKLNQEQKEEMRTLQTIYKSVTPGPLIHIPKTLGSELGRIVTWSKRE